MDARYPGVLDHGQPWVYSIAGGAMIQMKLYFASLTEYIMIWGTPIGSEGHSGRHFSGFWDTVIDGETWYYGEGQFEKSIYKPGDRIYVGPGQARAMNFTNGVWAVEYARGFIPLSRAVRARRRADVDDGLRDRGADGEPVHGPRVAGHRAEAAAVAHADVARQRRGARRHA